MPDERYFIKPPSCGLPYIGDWTYSIPHPAVHPENT
jgi:hypothetical protein